MKITLCTVVASDRFARLDPKNLVGTGQVPRLGVVYLAHWMERNGYGPNSYDFYDIGSLNAAEDEVRAYFRASRPDVVGISAIFIFSYKYVKRLAQIVREECPEAWIVVGGHIAAAANVILAKTRVDICVAGDGELPWLDFLAYVKRNGRARRYDELEKIPGIAFLDADSGFRFNGYAAGITGSDIPLTDYDLLRRGLKNRPELLDMYFMDTFDPVLVAANPLFADPARRPRGAHLPASKGCVARCTFCQRAAKGYRALSLDQIEEHVVYLKKHHNVGFISTLDENFGSNRKHAFAFAELMKKHGILWDAGGVRVNTFSYEDLKFLKEHNCVSLFFGIETGSQAMIDVMEKKITVEQTLKALSNCIALDMPVTGVKALLGLPGETEETARETGRFFAKVAHLLGAHPSHLGFNTAYVIPIPGTPVYEYGQQVGVIPTDLDGEEELIEGLASLIDADKAEYINVSGAPAKEAFFWDVLIHMEASRVYGELCREKAPVPTRMGQALLASRRPETIRFWNLPRAWVKNSAVIDALPRWLVYPLVKNFLYADFRLRTFLRGLMGQGYRFTRYGVARARMMAKTLRTDTYTGLDQSLRGIVRSRRPAPLSIHEQGLQLLRDGQ